MKKINMVRLAGFTLAMVLMLSSGSIAYAKNDKDKGNDNDNNGRFSSSFCDRFANRWWGGSRWCRDDNNGNNSGRKPLVYLFATDYAIKNGTSTTLYWDALRADSCTASGDGWSGTRATSSRENVSPTKTTKYTITCTNQFGSYKDSATITVMGKKPPVTPPATTTPTLSFVASSTQIAYGSSTVLAWNSTNTNSCLASNGWTGSKSLSGNQTVSPVATTTYTLACGNGNATSTQSVTVNVATSTVVVPPAAVTLDFNGSPLAITDEQDSTLTWASANATLCVASNGWSGNKALSSNQVVSPNATTTYTLACGNSAGTTTKSVTIDVTPVVEEPEPTTLDHIVISEVYYDVGEGKGTEPANEWIELYNGTGSTVNVGGWFITDTSNEFDYIPAGTTIPSGSFLVVTAASTTPSFWSGTSMTSTENRLGNALGNTNDSIYLRNAASTTVDAVGYGTDTGAFNPAVNVGALDAGQSIRRSSLTTDTNSASDWAILETPTPGSL